MAAGFNPIETRALSGLAGLYALRMLGLFMVLPVLSIYAQDLQGATPLLIGLALGGYGLTQALLQIPFGLLSDRIGRKTVIYLGLALFILGSVVAAVSDSMWGVVLGRCLQGSGAIASSIMALLADLTREEVRTRAMATVGLSIGMAFMLSLVLGPLLAAPFGLAGLFWFTALVACIGILVVWRWIPTPQRYARHLDVGVQTASLGQVIRQPELLRLDGGIFILHLVLTACFVVLPLRLHELGLDVLHHWWVYLPVMGGSFIAMIPFVILAEKKRQMRPVFLSAIGVQACAAFALALIGETWLGLIAGLFVFFMAFNLLEATLPSLISKLAPTGSKGTAMGVYSSSQFFGAFLGGVLGGTLYAWAGINAVFAGAGLLLALWWSFALSMAPPRHLSSQVIALDGHQVAHPQEVSEQLLAITGIEEVVILAEEGTAYLKVDRHLLSEEIQRQLQQGRWTGQASAC
ncbi:Predicted arabinose efflux permease, MFS family [Allopseudospirillum japonicum]|uniref:Predicted arabinose efflux permease, MFS family n=1 Tax=Allopseudospirillum japonicum TaxID=64971 RepID=A0A1H6UQ65_9GAMM|nr:MFS transporter [Allopseudospirillum japonicum]SEI92834.1 Predicted arabinose efflux permease, MFS family [Allopseudospirillum japonicum]